MSSTIIPFKVAPLAPFYEKTKKCTVIKRNVVKNSRKENAAKNVLKTKNGVKNFFYSEKFFTKSKIAIAKKELPEKFAKTLVDRADWFGLVLVF
ncbi:hypothetical protein LDL59_09295 [Kaistella anthropi]|nr:hypothetical protein [Kaistella anthropi]